MATTTAPGIPASARPAAGQVQGPQPLTTAQLMNQVGREFILLIGKDGAGKSCALVSLAAWVQLVLAPDATFYVIDTENKFPTALRSFGPEAPTNIVYFKCETMNDVTDAIDVIMEKRKPGDWLAAESMSRVWERAQDMGYRAVSGYDKAKYLEIRRERAKSAPVIPKPDDFWSIVKGAHDGAFLDLISQAGTLNVCMTTTVSKPKNMGQIKENETRKGARLEFGIDSGLDGAPRLPYYFETTAILDAREGAIYCRVLRDNPSPLEAPRVEFLVPDKKTWAQTFWTTCR